MKKKYILEAVAVVLCLGIAAVWYFGGAKEIQKKKQISVEGVEIYTTDTYTKTNVSYPTFSGPAEIMNAPIKKVFDDAIAEHKKNSEENWKARVATALPNEKINATPGEDEKFDFYGKYEIVQLNENYASILVRYGAFSGGAHGYENVATFNYDLKNKKEVTLQDLFGGSPDYLGFVSEVAIESLKKQIPEMMQIPLDEGIESQINEGAGPKAENFRNFTFNERGLRIYFAQYQVGPYVIGMPTVDIPVGGEE